MFALQDGGSRLRVRLRRKLPENARLRGGAPRTVDVLCRKDGGSLSCGSNGVSPIVSAALFAGSHADSELFRVFQARFRTFCGGAGRTGLQFEGKREAKGGSMRIGIGRVRSAAAVMALTLCGVVAITMGAAKGSAAASGMAQLPAAGSYKVDPTHS